MDDQANQVGIGPCEAERMEGSGAVALRRKGRMSRQRKIVAVLWLLCGDELQTVSGEPSNAAATLTGWHDAFLAAGGAALRARAARGGELASEWLKAKLGGTDRARPAAREDRPAGGHPPFGPQEASAISEAVSPVSGRR